MIKIYKIKKFMKFYESFDKITEFMSNKLINKLEKLKMKITLIF